MTELPHKLRNQLPEDAKSRADAVAAEMMTLEAQRQAMLQQTMRSYGCSVDSVGGAKGKENLLAAAVQLIFAEHTQQPHAPQRPQGKGGYSVA